VVEAWILLRSGASSAGPPMSTALESSSDASCLDDINTLDPSISLLPSFSLVESLMRRAGVRILRGMRTTRVAFPNPVIANPCLVSPQGIHIIKPAAQG
jgi:hypothetical protein